MRLADVKEAIANALYGVIRWTVSTATVDAKTRFVGVEGHAVDASDPESQWQARLVQHFGFASSPPKNSELITASIGGEGNNTAIVAEYTPGKGPDDLAEGDVSVFGNNDAQILRMNSADNTTELKTAGGTIKLDSGDIILNGGSQKVSRVGDRARGKLRATYTIVSTTPPVFAMTLSVVNGTSVTVLASFTAAGSVTIPAAPGVPYDVEIDSELFEGADHVLA